MALIDYIKQQANAVRTKDGTTEPIPFVDIADRILAIPSDSGDATAILNSLSKLTSNLITIEPESFKGHELLTSVEFPKCTTIEAGAFQDCIKLASVTMPNSTTVKQHAFDGCINLPEDLIINNLSNIGDYAYANCTSIKSVKAKVTGMPPFAQVTFGKYAFKNCISLATVGQLTENNYMAWPEGMYYGCASLSTLPPSGRGVDSIGDYCFYGCTSLSVININNVDHAIVIGAGAFENCSNLTSVKITPNLNYVKTSKFGAYAFKGCSSLTSLRIDSGASVIPFGSGMLDGTPLASGSGTIFVSSVALNSYKSASGWMNYSARMQAT